MFDENAYKKRIFSKAFDIEIRVKKGEEAHEEDESRKKKKRKWISIPFM